MNKTQTITREQWLQHAVTFLRKTFPDVAIPAVNVSCSWPGGGSARKRIGECWPTKASQAGVNEVFISPKIEDSAKVLGILIHELAHAVDDCANGHRAAFTAIARKMGCEGKATQMAPSDTLLAGYAAVMAAEHGAYPHRVVDKALSGQKKQTTRMLKCQCRECGAIFRTTKKVVDAAMEHLGLCCPVCHELGAVDVE